MNKSPMDRLLERMRELAQPEDPVEYRCKACCDTGLIEVSDGLVDGRRVSSPTVVACTSIVHERKRADVTPTPERFS